jgi:toxin ParE1/3/4
LNCQALLKAISTPSPITSLRTILRPVSFLREIGTQILAVGQNPLLYQLRPEIGEGARMAIVGRYVILFRTMGEVVRIERVVYGGRDLLALFQQEE